jgi:hypothetical protein
MSIGLIQNGISNQRQSSPGEQEDKATPEVIAKATDAPNVLQPPGSFLRDRLNSLISMLENQLI